MNENEQVEFYIEVKEADATAEELDQLARQLLSERRETEVNSAALTGAGSSPFASTGRAI